ncbi:MAG: molybdopterin converting factor [Thermoprotei archaeon]|nr:MAG: molybdopterin converting factor [Thermoprotei archaeon]
MSIKVTVIFLHRAGELVGDKHRITKLELPDNATLKDLVITIRNKISKRIGEGILSGRLWFNIIVDGISVSYLNHPLRNGSRIVFLTPEMGG